MKLASTTVDPQYPKAILFDLLTALLDSWTLWNQSAGSEQAGRAWRAEYLRLTYGCGKYVAYETLVEEAAANVGLAKSAPRALENNWLQLAPWSGAVEALEQLQAHCKLAVVTNCSTRLGRQAAQIFPVKWDAIITAEEAGVYKPDPLPYRMTLDKLGVLAADAAFVAGSSYDMFGTAKTGLKTYWHNRVGLALVEGAPPPDMASPNLDGLVAWAAQFGTSASNHAR
ncbi:HAD-IA family hydrolase [Collimonas sp. NPDC087041]|uniref:HAD-IA family hydrolase n=1 Tax=Collimonas sp. NPDC087041 TaxID=3363960 RepID=UPI00382672D9